MQSGRTAFVLFIPAASYPFRKGSFGSLLFSMTEASISANPCGSRILFPMLALFILSTAFWL